MFVGYLIENNRRSSTIKSYISAIKSVLREDGEILNEDTFLLTSLTRACKFQNDTVRTLLPIRKGLLHLLYETIPRVFGEQEQIYLTYLYRAMLVTAYYGLFRIGEVSESEHVIKAKDVHIGRNKNKLMFILHTSKTECLTPNCQNKCNTNRAACLDKKFSKTIHRWGMSLCTAEGIHSDQR